MAGAPEEPYRMLIPDINSGVGAKGADRRRPRTHQRAWQSGRRGLGQNINRAKSNQRERSGAHRLGRARMVQNTDARVARDYADAGRRGYHSALAAGEGANVGYRAVAQSVDVAHRSDHGSQLDSGRTDGGGRRS